MAMDLALTAYSRYTLKSLTPAQGTASTKNTAAPTSSLAAFSPERLTSGSSVITGQTLSDPTVTASNQKLQIDQSISTVRAGQAGANSATVLLAKMKGLVRDAESGGGKGKALDTTQFNDLAKQLNQAVTTNGSYQGLNLINDSTASLSVKFRSSSGVTIDGVNLNGSALLSAMAQASAATSDGVFAAMAHAAGATDSRGFSALDASSTKGRAVLDNMMGQLDSAISTTGATAKRMGQHLASLPALTSPSPVAAMTSTDAQSLAMLTGQQVGSQYWNALAGSQRQAIYAMLR